MKTTTHILSPIKSVVKQMITILFLHLLFSINSFGQAAEDSAISFSVEEIVVPGSANPLPLMLLNFDVKASQGNALVQWSMYFEVDYSLFTIECTLDGNQWKTIHNVGSEDNLIGEPTYSWLDNNPYAGISYYRLKVVDMDGKERYSEVKSFQLTSEVESELRAYPNPASSSITVGGVQEDIGKLIILNASGVDVGSQIILTESNANQVVFDISTLPSGDYYVKTPTSLVKLLKL